MLCTYSIAIDLIIQCPSYAEKRRAMNFAELIRELVVFIFTRKPIINNNHHLISDIQLMKSKNEHYHKVNYLKKDVDLDLVNTEQIRIQVEIYRLENHFLSLSVKF